MENQSSRKTKTPQNDDPLAASTDIVAAAQKLMQLSDEDNNKGNVDVTGKRRRIEGEEVDQIMQQSDHIKIKENIGVIDRPKKMKKYRSLVNIYRVTRPINVGMDT